MNPNASRDMNTPITSILHSVANGLHDFVSEYHDVGTHAKAAGLGNVELREKLSARLVELETPMQEFMLENDTEDDAVFQKVVPGRIAYSIALLAINSLNITDDHYRRAANAAIDILENALELTDVESVNQNEILEVANEALANTPDTVIYATHAEYAKVIHDAVVAQGDEPCGHLVRGYASGELDPYMDAPIGGLASMIAAALGQMGLDDDDEDDDVEYDA